MKKIFMPHILPLFTLGAGGLGFALRVWLFTAGVDEKGLVIPSHPANSLLFILSAAVICILFLCTRSVSKLSYKQSFPASPAAAVGHWIAAAGILAADFAELADVGDTITVISFFLGLLAAACLVYLGWCRLKHIHPSMIFYTVVTIYLLVHLMSQYRIWSPEPQLQNYCFQLFASIFLMLSLYHRTALTCRMGSRKWFLFCSQAALFFCCLSLQGESRLFYAAMAAWMTTDLCVCSAPRQEEITDVPSE